MKLRSRAVGAGNTFYPFKRLPIELRYMIWQYSLEPRVVEFDYASKVELTKEDELVYSHSSAAPVPVAFRVCCESRESVLPLYPIAFSSGENRSKVRFNFALDTLFFHDLGGDDADLFVFLDEVEPKDAARLQRIAFSEWLGWNDDDDEELKYWTKLGTYLERLRELKSIVTVHNVSRFLGMIVKSTLFPEVDFHRRELIRPISLEYAWWRAPSPNPHLVELFDNFPAELKERAGLFEEEIPLPEEHSESVIALRSSEWLEKRTKHVWGWWHLSHPTL